jgi:hypothetical protein
MGREEKSRQGQDDDQAGEDEADPSHDCPEATSQAPGAIDRQLRGGRTWKEVGGRYAVLELVGREPFVFIHAQFSEQGDVGSWATEPYGTDAPPLTDDSGERDVLVVEHGHARPIVWQVQLGDDLSPDM